MKWLTVFLAILMSANAAHALDYSGAIQQIQQANNCKFSGSYGSQLALGGKVEIFSGICGGNAYVGARQPNTVNAPWTFNNCGHVDVNQPPAMPQAPAQYLSEAFKKYDAWLLELVWKVERFA